MAELVDGQYRIKDEPPLIVHIEDQGDVKKTQEHEAERIKGAFDAYVETLPDDRKVLLSKYHFVDIARKVVGVGSVGTRAGSCCSCQEGTETTHSSCRSRRQRLDA